MKKWLLSGSAMSPLLLLPCQIGMNLPPFRLLRGHFIIIFLRKEKKKIVARPQTDAGCPGPQKCTS